MLARLRSIEACAMGKIKVLSPHVSPDKSVWDEALTRYFCKLC